MADKYRITYHDGFKKYAEANTNESLLALLGGIMEVQVTVKMVEYYDSYSGDWKEDYILRSLNDEGAKFINPRDIESF